MRRIRPLFVITIALAIFAAWISPAQSVENGVIVKDDPNAVYMFDWTGNEFLYSPYIVFTSAHGHETWKKEKLVVHNIYGQEAKVEKVLEDPNFRERNTDEQSRANGTAVGSRYMDFAILILETPLPVTNKVSLLKPEEVEGIITSQIPVYLVGYSSHDATRIRDGLARRLSGKLISQSEAKKIYDFYYTNWHPNWGPKGAKYDLGPLNVVQSEEGGSGCDGDSGAGWYILRGSEKVYLGPNGSHSVGVKNCGQPGFWGEAGNVSNIEPVFNHLELIKTAEEYVATKVAKLEADAKAKAEAEAKEKAEADAKAKAEAETRGKPTPVSSPTISPQKKLTIICIKGKISKKITGTNPRCPSGYRKK